MHNMLLAAILAKMQGPAQIQEVLLSCFRLAFTPAEIAEAVAGGCLVQPPEDAYAGVEENASVLEHCIKAFPAEVPSLLDMTLAFMKLDELHGGQISKCRKKHKRRLWAKGEGSCLRISWAALRYLYKRSPHKSRNAEVQHLKNLLQPSPNSKSFSNRVLQDLAHCIMHCQGNLFNLCSTYVCRKPAAVNAGWSRRDLKFGVRFGAAK